MKGYSLDLRERIVQARAQGKTIDEVAALFAVSVSTVKRYEQRQRQWGHLHPTQPQRLQPMIRDEMLEELRQVVQAIQDSPVEEMVEAWAQHSGQRVSVGTLRRALQRMGWSRKKRAAKPANVTKERERRGVTR